MEADPCNTNTLLTLGISSSNLFDRDEAIEHMRNWLKYTGNYSKIVKSWPEWNNGTSLSDKQIAIRNMFIDALKTNPNDFRLNEALGIVNFMNKDLNSAADCFRAALAQQ